MPKYTGALMIMGVYVVLMLALFSTRVLTKLNLEESPLEYRQLNRELAR